MIDPSERVAIVGIGGIFPGSPDPEAFWANVAAGIDATCEVPRGRWLLDPADAYAPGVATPDRVYATRGGFVRGFAFDPEGLDLDPSLVARLDPMFHLALHAGRQAWRDARTDGLDRSRVGVVFGNIVLPTETASALARETLGRAFAAKVVGRETEASGPLTDPLNRFAAGLPAGLLARGLGLGGGSYTLDAACASSLYALKLAADELLAGRVDAMITGGLSRPDALYTQMGFSQLRALSPDGRAYPFDARGGGLVVGEGSGMFVLKRLGDALRHGDRIYGLVAAVGLSNDVDGGLLAPSGEGQLRAMRAAYERAGWDPRSVDLIECHATGTPVGDAVEFQSLRTLWGPSGWSPGRCVVGSHKANIGHALTASGSAGLLKLLLSLQNRILPPTPNFATPNPNLGYNGSPFRVLTAAEPWGDPADGRPRRAAISGFGFGGINAHALIEEWSPAVASTSLAPGVVLDPEREADPAPIAVVGLGAHFGPFRGAASFRERVLGGREAEPEPARNDWGVGPAERRPGFHLDALELRLDRFRIPPKELEEMLPQQSLALLAAADAIADAGWDDRPRLRAGVYVGIGLDPNTTNFHLRWWLLNQARAWNDEQGLGLSNEDLDRWTDALREASGPPLTANRTMGALGGLIASRVAREFRLGGPSFTVSSEETSGLRSLEIAVRLLRQGELDAAVVGAVDLTGDPRTLEAARRAGLLDLARGDGATAVVLKRLEDAERDGDRVYAVIRGVGAASGPAIDAPAADAASLQSAVRQAIEEAGVDPASIGLAAAIGPERAHDRSPLVDQLGHTGASSGLAEFVKAVACVYEEFLPSGDDGVGPRYWLHDAAEGPRRAAVTASGADGSCVHVVLEAASESARPASVQPLGLPASAVFAVEADDAAGLARGLDDLDVLLHEHPDRPIDALARAWWSGRPNAPTRRLGVGIVAVHSSDLREKIATARRRIAGEDAPRGRGDDGVYYRSEPLAQGQAGRLALVFPGIGNHFAGMGRGLSARWPDVFRGLESETRWLRSQLAPGAAWDAATTPEFPDHRAPIMAQVVLGTAVADVLRSLGVASGAVIGYSLGESAALFATRTWTERDAMYARLDASPLFRTDLAGPCEAARRAWGLRPGEPIDWLAGIVAAPAEAVRAAMAGVPRAYLLIVNTPNECVVGGRRREIERVVKSLGATFLPLPVVSTVHCEVAREVEDAYRVLHSLATTPPPGVRFYSAAWGRAYVPDRATAAEAIVAQAVDTVDFPAVIRRAYDDGVRVFVETGPGASCSRMIRTILGDAPHLARSVCVHGEDDATNVLDLLARLIAERVPVDLASLYGRGQAPAVVPPPARRLLKVPVGGPPFQPPPPPAGRPRPSARSAPASVPVPEARPTVTEPHPAFDDSPPSWNGNGHTHVHVDGGLAVAELADPLTAQIAAAESSRGEAHEAYLRVAGDVQQTMANHMAFQMALIEALMAAPADAPATIPVRLAPAVPAPVPVRAPAPIPAAPARTSPPPALDREQCLEFAIGSIGKVLGEKFAAIDAHPTRVRLPDEPLMLVDRIVAIEGEPLSMTTGRVVTEHDVFPDDWYLDHGKTPACIAIESGQADLFLSGWLGIDFITRGKAVYRLLDAAVTFHRALPGPGETISYDIHISKFFRQGDTHLFRFHFDGSVNGEPLLTMRDGCAGFFTDEALAAGQGIVRRPLDLRPMPGVKPDDWTPLAPMGPVETLDEAQVDALRRGDLAAAFGSAFAGLELADPARLPDGRMRLIHRVPKLDPSGGRYGLGLIQGKLDIHPDDWFLTCHFVDDQVMPGTLMYECCLHTLRIFLTRMGWIGESAGVSYEPVPGVSSRLRCRGQVISSTKSAVFEISLKEIGYGPEPYAIADAMMYADGKAVVEVVDMTLRLAGLDRDAVERLWAGRKAASIARPALFTREQVLAFATGKPSEAFGERYRPFDEDRFIARLPAPPYSFLDRVVEIQAEAWRMTAGGSAVAEYDVPTDAWYFASNRQARMPFAVLQEISLQACGWLAAYMGSALASDEDMAFRNLGGSAVLLRDVTPASGTLATRVKATRVSRSGGMIIQNYDFETSDAAGVVYRGETYFGFFRREALLDQVGIREAKPYEPTPTELARARSLAYPQIAPYPDDQLRMVDRIVNVPDGGPAGLGFVRGTLAVDTAAWFFKAHFHQDPVCPGSLGLESLQQLLKFCAVERWSRPGETVAFEPIGLGEPHRWLYRGQVVPDDREVTVQAIVTAVDDARRVLKGDGFLSVDGRLIYQMNDFSVRIV